MDTDETTQPRIGRRMVDAFARMHVGVRGETLRMEGAHRDAWLTAWLERAERELAPTVEALYGDLLAHPELPPGLRATIEQGVKPTNQVDFLLNIILTVAGVAANAGAITQPFVQRAVNSAWVRHPDRPLTPEEAAVAFVKGQMSFSDAATAAGENGLNEAAFQILANATGDPPGVMTLLDMWRRGIIDTARLVQGIQQSRLKLEWASSLEAYAFGPASASEAILGNVQNHLDAASARAIVAQNGIDPANYDWLFQNAGRPPGPMEMISAWNRGAVVQATVEQAIRESDIKDKYVPTIIALREHLLPQKTVVAGVHQGVIPDAVATSLLLKLGISATNAAYLIQEGHNLKSATHKALSESQIATAYEDGSLTRADALAHLVTLGYLSADATFILDLVDVKWQQALHNATVSRIRALYLGHHIERTVASGDLDAAGVSAAHRDLYLQLWDITRTTPSRELTEAQIVAAFKAKILGEPTFHARLTALGYSAFDISVITYTATGTKPPSLL